MKDASVISCNFDDEYFVCSDSALLSDTEQTVNLSSPLHLSPSPSGPIFVAKLPCRHMNRLV